MKFIKVFLATYVMVLFCFVHSVLAFDCALQTEIPRSECDALNTLYISTSGHLWHHNTGWEGAHPCSSYGIKCSGGSVRSLHFFNNNLSGSIPPEIGNLTDLIILELSSNQLFGSILSQVGNLTKLNGLYLDRNQLSGSIPAEIYNLTSLREINLNHNQLSGSISPEIDNLINLVYLNLSNNNLSGSIPPEIGNMTDLGHLGLCSNQLCGEIPFGLTNLKNLYGAINLCIQNNYLITNNSVLDEFLVSKGGDWKSSQGDRCPVFPPAVNYLLIKP